MMSSCHLILNYQWRILIALLALCAGNPPVTSGFPAQRASNFQHRGPIMWKVFPSHDVIMPSYLNYYGEPWLQCPGMGSLWHERRQTHFLVKPLMGKTGSPWLHRLFHSLLAQQFACHKDCSHDCPWTLGIPSMVTWAYSALQFSHNALQLRYPQSIFRLANHKWWHQPIDLIHESMHQSRYPTMHHFVTEMCICTFLLQSGALWDICLMYCGICKMHLSPGIYQRLCITHLRLFNSLQAWGHSPSLTLNQSVFSLSRFFFTVIIFGVVIGIAIFVIMDRKELVLHICTGSQYSVICM